MTQKFSHYDSADYLQSEEDMALYLDACIEDDPGDGSLIRTALGSIARAKGMNQLVHATGISRETLYLALSSDGNPEFSTIMQVIRALDLKLRIQTAYT
jgi:probable addiction module antidote protein